MKNAKMKYLNPIGISALALLAFQLPVNAQEPSSENPPSGPEIVIDGSVRDAAAAETEGAPAHVERDFQATVDEVAKADTLRLDRYGIVSKQADIMEQKLILEGQISHAKSVEQLVELLGVDAFRLMYPELAKQLEGSPILLDADLKRAQIQREIQEALEGPSDSVVEAPKARDDGSSFFDPTYVAPPSANARQTAAAPDAPSQSEIVELIRKELSSMQGAPTLDTGGAQTAAPLAPIDIPVSLREVYGLAGNFSAVIVHGEERIRVREGDLLPNDTIVQQIDETSITILRHGKPIKIQIRG